jgi:hypothetical protein
MPIPVNLPFSGSFTFWSRGFAMRIYFSSEFSRFFSAVALVIAVAAFGFAVWKAATVIQSDTNLKEIQELVNPDKG